MMTKKEKELKGLLRSYGHRYYKEAHQKQNYDPIDDDFIPKIVKLFNPTTERDWVEVKESLGYKKDS